MITEYPNRTIVVACLVFVLASVGLTLFVWRSVGGSIPLEAKQYEVVARFANASQLTPNADVRVAGVSIGKVTTVRPRGLRTEAVLSIDAKYAPLPRDVRAILRQKTLLGETYVGLSQGSPDGPRLADGGTIPAEQIEGTQPLDRVLSTLDADGRRRLHELLVDTGTLFDGRAEDLSNALGNLPAGMGQLEAVTTLLDEQEDTVSTLVARTGEVLQTVGDEEDAVRRLVREGGRALSATASRDAELNATVRAAPALLRELRATSRAVERTAGVAAPVIRELRPVAPKVAPTLRALREATPDLDGLLRGLEVLAPTARRSLPAAASLLEALEPFMERLQPAAQQVTPMLSYISAYRRELTAAMANVGASLKGRSTGADGTQKAYIRTVIPIGPETLVGHASRLPSNRHNAYMAPGGLARLAEGLLAKDCKDAGASAVPAPPCRAQDGWSFENGPKRYFQRLTERPVVPEQVDRVRSMFG